MASVFKRSVARIIFLVETNVKFCLTVDILHSKTMASFWVKLN